MLQNGSFLQNVFLCVFLFLFLGLCQVSFCVFLLYLRCVSLFCFSLWLNVSYCVCSLVVSVLSWVWMGCCRKGIFIFVSILIFLFILISLFEKCWCCRLLLRQSLFDWRCFLIWWYSQNLQWLVCRLVGLLLVLKVSRYGCKCFGSVVVGYLLSGCCDSCCCLVKIFLVQVSVVSYGLFGLELERLSVMYSG